MRCVNATPHTAHSPLVSAQGAWRAAPSALTCSVSANGIDIPALVARPCRLLPAEQARNYFDLADVRRTRDPARPLEEALERHNPPYPPSSSPSLALPSPSHWLILTVLSGAASQPTPAHAQVRAARTTRILFSFAVRPHMP